MELVLLLIRIFLFGVFAVAGIGKLMDRAGSEKAVSEFGVPGSLAKPVATGLPIVELLIALGLLFAGTSWLASIAALMLLLVFVGGMLYQIAQGNAPDCHCFGQLHSEPVGKASLIRNIGFAVLALFIAVQGNNDQGLSIADGDSAIFQSLLLIAVLLAVAVVIFYIRSIMTQQTQILRRLEMIEILGGGGSAHERDDAGNPEDALPIGAPFPDFELPDISGKKVRFEHLLANAKPMLFFFVGPNCTPCKALYPEIETWQEEFKDKLNFVLVSSGKPDENTGSFTGSLGAELLLQTNRELADKVHAKWTPTAIFVSADGNVASHPAVGDAAIRELLGKIRGEDLGREYVFFSNGNNHREIRIGNKIPSAELKTLDGETFMTDELLGSKTLAVFWSLSCPHCRNMIGQLKEWEETKSPHDPKLIIFSDGDPEELRETGITTPIVLDPNYTASAEFGMYGTPSGVLVDENGIIATEPGIGAPNIWSLIGKDLNTSK
jgi:thiol-disulfide isomerase/thioredoxin